MEIKLAANRVNWN